MSKRVSILISDDFVRLLKLSGVSPQRALKSFAMMALLEKAPAAHALVSKNMYKDFHLPSSYFRNMDRIAEEIARDKRLRDTVSRLSRFKERSADISEARKLRWPRRLDV